MVSVKPLIVKNTNHVALAKEGDNSSSIHLFSCLSEAEQIGENMTFTSLKYLTVCL